MTGELLLQHTDNWFYYSYDSFLQYLNLKTYYEQERPTHSVEADIYWTLKTKPFHLAYIIILVKTISICSFFFSILF